MISAAHIVYKTSRQSTGDLVVVTLLGLFEPVRCNFHRGELFLCFMQVSSVEVQHNAPEKIRTVSPQRRFFRVFYVLPGLV
mmetsp:Transcript_79235/g.132323  ORF Transcript_79235/g.132323 Transcript_79235/m.132323 type:complete len:81 (-) Transcript_79235:259-501(-)